MHGLQSKKSVVKNLAVVNLVEPLQGKSHIRELKIIHHVHPVRHDVRNLLANRCTDSALAHPLHAPPLFSVHEALHRDLHDALQQCVLVDDLHGVAVHDAHVRRAEHFGKLSRCIRDDAAFANTNLCLIAVPKKNLPTIARRSQVKVCA